MTEMKAFILKGTVQVKITKFENIFLRLMKCQHVADVVVEFYSCATCVKGDLRGLNSTIIRQYLRNVRRKIALLKGFNFETSKESNSYSF